VSVPLCSCSFAFYTLGFPLFVFVLLMRSFATEETAGVLGWLRANVHMLRGKKKKLKRASLWANSRRDLLAAPSSVEGGGVAAKYQASDFPDVHKGVSGDEPSLEQMQAYRANEFGFLYLGFRPDYFVACLNIILISLVVALVSVFLDHDAISQMFVFGLMSAQ
jgi:hypothetical protein